MRLSADALRLSGADESTRMRVKNAMYGLNDAPRSW